MVAQKYPVQSLNCRLSVIHKLNVTLPSPTEEPVYGVHWGQYLIICEASQKPEKLVSEGI